MIRDFEPPTFLPEAVGPSLPKEAIAQLVIEVLTTDGRPRTVTETSRELISWVVSEKRFRDEVRTRLRDKAGRSAKDHFEEISKVEMSGPRKEIFYFDGVYSSGAYTGDTIELKNTKFRSFIKNEVKTSFDNCFTTVMRERRAIAFRPNNAYAFSLVPAEEWRSPSTPLIRPPGVRPRDLLAQVHYLFVADLPEALKRAAPRSFDAGVKAKRGRQSLEPFDNEIIEMAWVNIPAEYWTSPHSAATAIVNRYKDKIRGTCDVDNLVRRFARRRLLKEKVSAGNIGDN